MPDAVVDFARGAKRTAPERRRNAHVMSPEPPRDTGRPAAAEESPFKGRTGVTRILNALRYSLHGLASAYRHEEAFRQEVWLAAVLIPLAFVFDVSRIERAAMLGSVLVVLMVELLNSAIEAAVDRISLDRHRLSKRAKDIGSAAVFVSLVNVAVVWALILLP
jgi:diacylglycerol kinase (ATP)